MKILSSIIAIALISFSNLYSWTFSPQEFLKSGNLDDLFSVKQTPQQKAISDNFFTIINTQEMEWKLEKDPFDFDNEMSFFLIPADEELKNTTERMGLILYKNQPPESLDKKWEMISKNFSGGKIDLVNKNEGEFDFIIKNETKYDNRNFYMLGHVAIVDRSSSFFLYHTVKNKRLTETQINKKLENLKKCKWLAL